MPDRGTHGAPPPFEVRNGGGSGPAQPHAFGTRPPPFGPRERAQVLFARGPDASARWREPSLSIHTPSANSPPAVVTGGAWERASRLAASRGRCESARHRGQQASAAHGGRRQGTLHRMEGRPWWGRPTVPATPRPALTLSHGHLCRCQGDPIARPPPARAACGRTVGMWSAPGEVRITTWWALRMIRFWPARPLADHHAPA